jgi:biopolymer transport protein ExbB/TolQ
MLKTIRQLLVTLLKVETVHKQEVVVKPDMTLKLQRELSESQQKVLGLNRRLKDSVDQSSLWMKKSAILQDKLSASQGHVKVLEGVLEESNKTIEALNLAIELQDAEETEGLQRYINELETEIDDAVALITKYGLQMRKA